MLKSIEGISPASIVARIKNNFCVRPLRESADDLNKWFESPLGQYYLHSETALIESTISNLFGYHLMQISTFDQADFSSSSRINHCFNLSSHFIPDSEKNGVVNNRVNGAFASFDALPFAEEEIDVTILHHVLEFSHNPHQVLKEAARVTVPRGYVIICGFNPLSVDGIVHKFGRGVSGRAIWRRHRLNTKRMKDWLKLLEFSCVQTHYTCFNFALNNQRYLEKSAFIDRKLGASHIPLGGSYCLIARKDKVGLTPIKMDKNKSSLINALPIPKQAMQVNSRKDGLILPFRLKSSKKPVS